MIKNILRPLLHHALIAIAFMPRKSGFLSTFQKQTKIHTWDAYVPIPIKVIDKRIVILANDQKVEMDLAGPFIIQIGKRKMSSDCLIGPPGCEFLVGQLIMEGMDLISDPLHKTISPILNRLFRQLLK